ncbi:MAG TPA: methyltransferase domain-containing protein [Nocardioidaceae bacterium]|nr:methyltransferase domain-containing protein [Nocardioidaceae bacterium]
MTDLSDRQDVKLNPRGFQRGHVPEQPDEELAGLVFVLDAQAQQPAVVRLREWSTTKLAPAAGEFAVDVGSGTGSEVLALAALVGTSGRAVGIEPHPGLRAEAARRANNAGSTAEFVDASATDLPFADATVDLLRCERVFQHLEDPQGAATEFARVLAPGGRVAILDSDWATAISTPGDPDVVRRMNEVMWARTPNPFAGRHLRTQLVRAGLVPDPDVGSSALVMPPDMTPFLIRTTLDESLEAGAITQAEADAQWAALTEAVEKGESFLSVTMFAVVATKPS